MVMSKRKAHLLKQLKSTTRPTNLVFFDTETSRAVTLSGERKHSLKLGVAIHCRSRRGERLRQQSEAVFQRNNEFWDYVEAACLGNATLYLIAHNIVFDLVIVDGFQELVRRGWKLESFYTKGLTSIFRWRKGQARIYGLDNGNFFQGKLSDWGKTIGTEKLDIDFATVSDEALITYCRRDVLIMIALWHSWLGFLDDNKCGAFKPTVGSTAISTWRHSYMRKPLYIHNDPLALQLEREAYKGGRTEVLYQGKAPPGQYYYLDINSMYGYVLSRHLYPSGFYRSVECGSISLLLHKIEHCAVIARVDLNVTENWYPFKQNGFTCYPLGRFQTVLTTPELKLAIQRGWVENVYEMSYYPQKSLFAEYVHDFYNLRKQYLANGNAPYAVICKLLVNSFYGKFGQMGFEQRVIGSALPDEIWSMSVYNVDKNEWLRHISLAGQVYEERRVGEAYNSFPAIAAHVTAYARMQLYKIKQLVPAHHAYYMDTDSLIVDAEGYQAVKHLVRPSELGALKIEYESENLEIYAPKDYVMGDMHKIKGIRDDAIELRPGAFQQDQWIRLPGMLARGNVSQYLIQKIVKHQRREIHSGVVQPDGWIDPFVLQPEQVLLPAEF